MEVTPAEVKVTRQGKYLYTKLSSFFTDTFMEFIEMLDLVLHVEQYVLTE
jgi:hypothetical protein